MLQLIAIYRKIKKFFYINKYTKKINISYYIQSKKNFYISFISYRINNLLNKIMSLKKIYKKIKKLYSQIIFANIFSIYNLRKIHF